MSTQVVSAIEEVRSNLMRLAPEFQKALPPQITADKFMRVVMTAIQTNPTLIEADRQSLWSACVRAATDGLLPDGKEAALVTFKTRDGRVVAQYIPMIGGILKKIRNSGELLNITSRVVYERDEFDYWTDETGEHIKHRPCLNGDRGKPRLTYAIANTKDEGVYVEVMTEEQIGAVRDVSRAKDGPWNGPFADEMRRKTALRRLSKRLPMSTDIEVIVQRDDDLYDLKAATPSIAAPVSQGSRLERIVDANEGPKLAVPVAVSPAQVGSSPAPAPVPDKQIEQIAKTFNATPADNATGRIEGKIENYRSKEGLKSNGQKWTRWAISVNGMWFGTFSETHARKMAELNARAVPVQVLYTTRIDGDRKYYDVQAVSEILPPTAPANPVPSSEPTDDDLI